MDSWKFYLLLIVICLLIQGSFAMVELACVSFNKVRLQYYVSKNKKRAKWLSDLINNPSYLFGTTLIGVNTALVVGSECSRRFYESLGLNPDFAPITQILIVLIFAEISPMLAGRRYAENVAMLGVPFLMFFSILFRPIILLLDLLCKFVAKLFKTSVVPGSYLSREELQNIIEEREETLVSSSNYKEFNTVVSNIFLLKNKTAKDLMQQLSQTTIVPSSASVAQMQQLVKEKELSFLPIYHRNLHNIVAVAYPRDFLRVSANTNVFDHARSPWFITEKTSILQILKQFRRNNQSLAVVLNEVGLATGILTLDEIVDEIFGRSDSWISFPESTAKSSHVIVDRTFPSDHLLSAFNEQFHVHLAYKEAETLEEVMIRALGHPPSKGESVRIDQFELTVEEASLLGAKIIHVRTVY